MDAPLPFTPAGVAELADARDLKSREDHSSYRFDPGHRHPKETMPDTYVSGIVSLEIHSFIYTARRNPACFAQL